MNDLFTKPLSHFFSPEEIRLIFENNRRYFEVSQSIEGVTMPKPLSYTDKDISFEKLPGLTRTLGQEWFYGEKWDGELCRKIGYILGRFHKAQGNLHEKIYLHGDFVPHNIVVRKTDMVFFDCEPPGRHRDFSHFYQNYNYVDIASFLFYIFTSHSFKKPWQFFRNKRPFVASFLKGYEEGASFTCDRELVLRYIRQELAKWLKDCLHQPVRKWIEYAILRVALFVQLSIHKACS